MSNQWFRFYDDAVNDPKVQKLPAVLFKTWVNLLCLSSKNNGALPSIADVVFTLRTDRRTLLKQLDELRLCGLIDEVNERLQPHNWNERQFKSDTSKERTKAYRDRIKGRRGDENVTSHVTPPEADTDTDTERRITHTNAPAQKLKLENLSYSDIEPWINQQSVTGNPITVDVRAELERFKTHFLSYGGKDKNGNAISDWVAKFGSWILNEQKQQKYGAKNEKDRGNNQSAGGGAGHVGTSITERTVSAVDAIIAAKIAKHNAGQQIAENQ